MSGRLQQRETVPRGELFDRPHRSRADPAGGRVDRASERDVVGRVREQLEIGEKVLDFLPLVELDRADELERDPFTPEDLLELTGLSVRSTSC